MLTINEAGQKWFFDNIVFEFFNAKTRENWNQVKDAWFRDIEQCVIDSYYDGDFVTGIGDVICYEIDEQFALENEMFTLHIDEDFIHKYFDKRVIDETS